MKNAGAPQMTVPEHNPAVPQGLVLSYPEMECMHFVMKDDHHTFLLSLENILFCLREAGKQGEVSPIDEAWRDTLSWRYPDNSVGGQQGYRPFVTRVRWMFRLIYF